MSITGLIIALIIASAFALWVAAPLFQRNTTQYTQESDVIAHQRERLMAYYGRVLRNIHDLDEDYATGKLDAADYDRDRALWVERGIRALKAVDDLQSQLIAPVTTDDAALDAAIDRAIEDAVREVRSS